MPSSACEPRPSERKSLTRKPATCTIRSHGSPDHLKPTDREAVPSDRPFRHYRDGLGDLELCRSLAGLSDPINDRRCFNCTQAVSIILSVLSCRTRSAMPMKVTAESRKAKVLWDGFSAELPGFVCLRPLNKQ
jgi:hypothetical protein